MFTEKDLIAGETVLVEKTNDVKAMYLGSAGLAHFVSQSNKFKTGSDYIYTIEDLNKYFTIEQSKSNAVPLEKKVYDFVPVRVRDYEDQSWQIRELVLVSPENSLPYRVINNEGRTTGFKQCEFLNQQ
jgi:hypothetical protein